jgi:hypothetical protein
MPGMYPITNIKGFESSVVYLTIYWHPCERMVALVRVEMTPASIKKLQIFVVSISEACLLLIGLCNHLRCTLAAPSTGVIKNVVIML